MHILDYMKNHPLYLDGSMGTLLQAAGLGAGELPEYWNLTHPEVVRGIHLDYYEAGSNVVSTNTFGANILKFSEEELERIILAAVENAKWAREHARGSAPRFVALDIGPTGRLLRPFGNLDFEEAVSVFAKTVEIGARAGVDLIFIETMGDSYETKAALLAAKEHSTLPVFVSNAYGADGKLMTGATPAAMVALLEGLGADAVGANCSLGPSALTPVVKELLRTASVPVLLKPNAGLPRECNGKTLYDVTPEAFATDMRAFALEGVRVLGGCCGTTPDYIRATVAATKSCAIPAPTKKSITAVSSYTHAVEFGAAPILIGERINPTGKKRFKEALIAHDMEYILNEGLAQQEKGVHLLDVNVGLPDIDECEMLTGAVTELQAIIDLPLQIDTANPTAMEAALRRYNGKAMVNSVCGKEESMRAVFPLVKKYGGVVVALTLDEAGIPETAEGRVEIARRILAVAKEYGIDKKDIIFDTLAMTISANPRAADVTLTALSRIRRELGCLTSLGVSNVSFGLPARDLINSTFFALALGSGLSAAIMNPYSDAMMKTYFSYRALCGLDENFGDYTAYATSLPEAVTVKAAAPSKGAAPTGSPLQKAIITGRKKEAADLCLQKISEGVSPLSIVETDVIPALDEVGRGFEEKRMYLPQLLMSAEAAQAAFAAVKAHMKNGTARDKGCIVLATVKGDIHDIGKNIVRLLLENYGFEVIDLGRDVPPEQILATAKEKNARVVGLSALMTTTVPAMKDTVSLLHEKLPHVRVMVGGAVLTAEYAARIGADAYAKDAMEAVRKAEELFRLS